MSAIITFKILFVAFVSFGISLGQECDSNGIKCLSCTDYQNCRNGSSEGEIISCKNGKDCADSNLELCRMKLYCYSWNECREVGIFPNVMVETDYFVCMSDSASGYLKYEFSCQEEYFFDASAKMCISKAATERAAEGSVEDVTTATPTIPDTPGTTTDSPPTTPDTPGTTTDSPTTPDTPDTTTTSPPTTPDTPGTTTTFPTTTTGTTTSETPLLCSSPGIFPNPSNCKMYYRCSTSLRVFHYICPGASYFNENIFKCSMIISPACKEQILKNSTTIATVPTTALPLSTATTKMTTTTSVPTTSPTSTPAPTTTPTTLATSGTTKPFSCPTSGTFENPTDCKTYYRCSSSGKFFRYTCPGSSYFNEVTKRCSLVITSRCKILIQG